MSGSKPRVCFVCLYAYPLFAPETKGPFGGSEVRVALLARELAKRGRFDVHLVVYDHGQPAREVRDGVTLHTLTGERPPVTDPALAGPPAEAAPPAPARTPRMRPLLERLSRGGLPQRLAGAALAFAYGAYGRAHRALRPWVWRVLELEGWAGDEPVEKRAVEIYRRIDADLYVVPGNHRLAAQVAVFCRKRRKKYVFLAGFDTNYVPEYRTRPKDLFDGVYGSALNFPIVNAAAHVVQTELQARVLAEGWGREATVVRNPIDLRRPVPRPPVPETVLWIGKSNHVKRPEIALEIAKAFPEERFVVVMTYVDAAIHERCTALASSLPNVTLRTYVPFEEIEAEFARAKLFLSTSSMEGFPNTFLQAAKYGVPIASLEIDPDGMLSRHGCGIACERDVGRLQEAVRRLLSDAGLREEAGRRALEYVTAHHDKERVVARFEEALLAVAI